MSQRKPLFTVLGEIVQEGNRRAFRARSPGHLQTMLHKSPLGPCAITFEKAESARSQPQLAYHWVLMTYLADYTGGSKEEVHDAVMRLKFGTKTLSLAGREVEVRQSVSDAARLPKGDMVELIDYDLQLCSEMGIVVPTAEELGYISN